MPSFSTVRPGRSGCGARARRSRCPCRTASAAGLAVGRAEQRREARGRLQRVADQVGRGGDAGRRLADGQLLAVAVEDRAAPRGHVDGRLLLGGGDAAQRVGPDDAEPRGLAAGARQGDEKEREDQTDAALDDRASTRSAIAPPAVTACGSAAGRWALLRRLALGVWRRGDGRGRLRGGPGLRHGRPSRPSACPGRATRLPSAGLSSSDRRSAAAA